MPYTRVRHYHHYHVERVQPIQPLTPEEQKTLVRVLSGVMMLFFLGMLTILNTGRIVEMMNVMRLTSYCQHVPECPSIDLNSCQNSNYRLMEQCRNTAFESLRMCHELHYQCELVNFYVPHVVIVILVAVTVGMYFCR